MHILKIENDGFFWRIFRGLQAWRVGSEKALRDHSKEVREDPGYVGVLQQKSGSKNTKLPLIKENQTPQVNEFTAFLYMGRCRGLGSLKSFL